MVERRRRLLAASAVLSVVTVLGACTGTGTPASESSSTSDGVEVDRSVVYREVDGVSLSLDSCRPAGGTGLQPVVLLHGGAFHEGDRSNLLDLCRSLAGAGFAAFPVDYRLVPASYPAQIDDVGAAVAWLREPEQEARFGIDGKSLSILGTSAGGIIALSAAESLATAGTPVSGVVTLSAAADLTADALTLGDPSPKLEGVVLAYLGCSDINACPDAVAASPITAVDQLPPTMLIAGTKELIPLEQTRALERGLQTAGIVHHVIEVPGSSHGLQLLSPDIVRQIGSFLSENHSP